MHRHIFEAMGTVVTIQCRDAVSESVWSQAVEQVETEFDALNQQYSLYRVDSELSQIASGTLSLPEASQAMREEYARALEWREKTDGAFTPHRPDGVIDLSGTIKAVALDRAALVLRQAGCERFSINAGGDILTAGGGWDTGIVDPGDRSQVLSTVTLTDDWSALCTSGHAERGDHIWVRPETDTTFVQASVIAQDVIAADVLATALIAGGTATLDMVTSNFDVAVLVVNASGELFANDQFRELITR